MKRVITMFAVLMALAFHAGDLKACTGISLTAADGSRVVARTVEWAATPMQCGYVVAPRGHAHQSYTPTGDNGLKYSAVYGYVGIYTEYEPFVVEGVNESGLSAGLFFFPQCAYPFIVPVIRPYRGLLHLQRKQDIFTHILRIFHTADSLYDISG